MNVLFFYVIFLFICIVLYLMTILYTNNIQEGFKKKKKNKKNKKKGKNKSASKKNKSNKNKSNRNILKKVKRSAKKEKAKKKKENNNIILDYAKGELPNEYDSEINNKIMSYFNEPTNTQQNFFTNDKKYKCSFINHVYQQNNIFQKTILDENDNTVYVVDTTQCSENLDDDRCNKDSSLNIEKNLFYKNNRYIDYDDEKYDIFLKGYELIDTNEINPTFKQEYEICKPHNDSYQADSDFKDNYPCGTLLCNPTSKKERKKSKFNYETLNETSKKYFDEIMNYEYKGKLDTIMESLGYKYWVDLLNTTQKNNQEIMDFEPVTIVNKNDENI